MLWIRPHVHKDLFMHTHRCSQIYFCMQVRSNISTNETLMGMQRQKVQTDFFRKWTSEKSKINSPKTEYGFENKLRFVVAL